MCNRNAHLRLWLACMSGAVSPTICVSSTIYDYATVLLERNGKFLCVHSLGDG